MLTEERCKEHRWNAILNVSPYDFTAMIICNTSCKKSKQTPICRLIFQLHRQALIFLERIFAKLPIFFAEQKS